MTDAQSNPANGKQPDGTAQTTPDAQAFPPVPDTQPAPPAHPVAASAAVKPSHRRTLTTLLIGAIAGATIVGGTWFTTSHTGSSTSTASSPAKAKAKTAATKDDGTFTLNGDFVLNEDAVSDGTGGCEGTGGYEDITLGTSVTVYDAAGAVIATGMLALSEFDESDHSCTYDVSVYDVPGDQDFYQVEIGHRGKLQLSAVDAKADGFSGSLG